MGLEVKEENNRLWIIIVDRDNLKKWIEEKSEGYITVTIHGRTRGSNVNQTGAVVSRIGGCEQSEGKRKKIEAEVILLKQKIEDQAQELNRFYKIFKEVMVQNKELRTKEQRKESEAGGVTEGRIVTVVFYIRNLFKKIGRLKREIVVKRFLGQSRVQICLFGVSAPAVERNRLATIFCTSVNLPPSPARFSKWRTIIVSSYSTRVIWFNSDFSHH